MTDHNTAGRIDQKRFLSSRTSLYRTQITPLLQPTMNDDTVDPGGSHDGGNTSPDHPVPPPTLKPYLDNLPSPASLTSSNPTPPAIRRDRSEREQDVLTPTRASFDLSLNDKEDDDEEEAVEEVVRDQDKEDEDESEEEDAEFQSHYSRQSSPATSDDSDSEDEDQASQLGSVHTADDVGQPIHRINSMPASATHPHPPPLLHSHSYSNGYPFHLSRSSASLHRGPPPLPPPLYPPFYNKPPTPLPPSPSLTSLLRPPSLLARSIPSTRPTSPDSSDLDTPHDTEAQITTSARRTTPLPPTAPKVPTYEYYGFVLYLASSLAFLMYILWAYLPSPFLHALGITYYPDRWWALAIPAWIVMALIWIYVALSAYNVEYLTLGMNCVETMVDEAGSVAILDENGRIRKGGSKRFVREMEERKRRELIREKEGWGRKHHSHGHGKSSGKKRRDREKEKEKDGRAEWYGYMGEIREGGVANGLTWRQIYSVGTDACLDVPLGGVCEVLYGDGREGM